MSKQFQYSIDGGASWKWSDENGVVPMAGTETSFILRQWGEPIRTATDHPAPASTGREGCNVCKGSRCDYRGVAIGDPPNECEACFDQEPAPATGGDLDVEAERRESIEGDEFDQALHAYVRGLASSENVAKYASAKREFIKFIDSWGNSLAARRTAPAPVSTGQAAPSDTSPVGAKEKEL